MTLSGAEEIAPSAAAMIESLRSMGYSVATSIADLVDNSVTAKAKRIDVKFHWYGENSYVTVKDDGTGMSDPELRDAMRAGSANPLSERSTNDLGRFGLGLKTASFSQARSLTVVSRRGSEGKPALRRWDLDFVGQHDKWLLLSSPRDGSAELCKLTGRKSGTLVIWESLDRIVDSRPASDERASRTFHTMVDEVREHLEMVFHRFLGDLAIYVNDIKCEPWDPFLSSHGKTQILEREELPDADGSIAIQPYILPHHSHLKQEEHGRASGPKGWNLQQGFYIYRADRLIVAGRWFSSKPEEHYKLARISVDLTQEMDRRWDLDVKKSRTRPPAALRDDFVRIGRATRERAQRAYRHRGEQSAKRAGTSTRSSRFEPAWVVEDNDGVYNYRVNSAHALVEETLSNPNTSLVKATLALLAETVPFAHILSAGFENEDQLPIGHSGVSKELEAAACELFDLLREREFSKADACEVVMKQQPFFGQKTLEKSLMKRN